MATPEAKQTMMERQIRRSRILAERYGTPEEVEQFQQTINAPTMGDTDLEKINIITAVNDMWEHISGQEVTEEEIMEEEKINEYHPDQDEEGGEPREWQPSYLNAEAGGQGVQDEEVAEAVREGDPEGQEADATEDLSPEEQNRADTDIPTNPSEAEESEE